MNGHERRSVTGYSWAAMAVLKCPCHLPLLAPHSAGKAAGAVFRAHWVIAALGLIRLFGLSVWRATRTFGGRA
ncbi:broad-spectrum mercury transporter MerE [Pseudoxanthomonas sp. SE1]|uniref:broad-spectrum mercury transporter MerE n=1 Tax=Pseudoxanthomonas sp. SE1 TaxID=1664560 RepID=UPI00240E5A30|nr:broad-spectrum mercury transporter MerE [Pseudoxanthomonas sp. SE1]WFC40273.1 broad-spectrum mercury transporter MerE [Pseudoxanthomonas sp. SE1]WFC43724.1 broad-spectrum mercury transporter MerE [Pseudoxanthomonas sp. SE1]